MTSEVRAAFALAVLRARRARHWTQAELAERAGITKTTVANVEHRRQGPSLDTAAMIAGAFGMKLGEMTDGEASRG